MAHIDGKTPEAAVDHTAYFPTSATYKVLNPYATSSPLIYIFFSFTIQHAMNLFLIDLATVNLHVNTFF